MSRLKDPVALLTRSRARDSYAHVLDLLERLETEGFEGYLVGGGIRDLLLERAVADWDVATDARPEQVLALWPEAIPTGIKHGTVTVLTGGGGVEITTYRAEGPYRDGRRPDWVTLGVTLEEDLSRRDFTVNAMAFHPRDKHLVDPHGGVADLENRVLRTVGDPLLRFDEDGLRPLRGIRLAAVLEMEVEPDTLQAMADRRERTAQVARERIRDELQKLLAAPRPSVGIELMRQTGILEIVLPELLEGVGMTQNRFHAYDVYRHSLETLDRAPRDKPVVRLAALLHDVGKPRTKKTVDGENSFYNHQMVGGDMTEEILDRLRFSRAERDRVAHLVREHMFHYTPEWSDAAVRRFLRRVGPENVEDLFDLRVADDHAHGTGKDPFPALQSLTARIEKVARNQEALRVTDLAVGGKEVMKTLGLSPGPKVGRILNDLLERVLEDPDLNTRPRLLDLARELSTLDDTEADA